MEGRNYLEAASTAIRRASNSSEGEPDSPCCSEPAATVSRRHLEASQSDAGPVGLRLCKVDHHLRDNVRANERWRSSGRDPVDGRIESCGDHATEQIVRVSQKQVTVANGRPQNADGSGDRDAHVGASPPSGQVIRDDDASPTMGCRHRTGLSGAQVRDELPVGVPLGPVERHHPQDALVPSQLPAHAGNRRAGGGDVRGPTGRQEAEGSPLAFRSAG